MSTVFRTADVLEAKNRKALSIDVLSWLSRSIAKFEIKKKCISQSAADYLSDIFHSCCNVWIITKRYGKMVAYRTFVSNYNTNLGCFTILNPNKSILPDDFGAVIIADISKTESMKIGVVDKFNCNGRNLSCYIDTTVNATLFPFKSFKFNQLDESLLQVVDYGIFYIQPSSIVLDGWVAHGNHNYDMRKVGYYWDTESLKHIEHSLALVFLEYVVFLAKYKLSHVNYPRTLHHMKSKLKSRNIPNPCNAVIDADYKCEEYGIFFHIDACSYTHDTNRPRIPQPHIYFTMECVAKGVKYEESGVILMSDIEGFHQFLKK